MPIFRFCIFTALTVVMASLLPAAALPDTARAQTGSSAGEDGVKPFEKRVGGYDADKEIDRLLYSESASKRSGAAVALGILRDARATGPLILALDDEDDAVRMNAAWAICVIDANSCEEKFMAALRAGDLPVIAGAYRYYIQRGLPDAEGPLVEGLRAYGTKKMASEFIRCGNSALEAAGRKWAKTAGVDMAGIEEPGRGPKWGADN